MNAAHATAGLDAAALDAALARHAPPRVELPPFTPAEIEAWFRGGELEGDVGEHLLVWAARMRGCLDVELAEGLTALRRGDRLAALGCHLDDYAREALDLGKRAAENLARLGAGLRERPLLREALRAGRVRLRAAETILPVAVGEAEAAWVERAGRETVRALEAAVRAARALGDGAGGAVGDDEDEAWVELRTQLPPDERRVLDEALALARELEPGSSRIEQLEVLAQEYLAEHPGDPDGDDSRPLGPGFRARGPESTRRGATASLGPDGWAELPDVPALPAPELSFHESLSAQELDARLRALAECRAGWERIIGLCGYAVKRSGMHRLSGYGSFREYVEERLGLPARAVEQRVALEARLAAAPALEEARQRGVSYEKLRVLARLQESDIARWIPRALEATCVALRREVEGEREGQLRARGQLVASLPRGVAVLLAAAIASVRERHGPALSTGTCLAVIAFHFLATWGDAPGGSRTRSRRIRERDSGWCQVPGCSRHAAHAHHIDFRSHGGSDASENLVGLCAFHHLRCIHGGHLSVQGRAPGGLVWLLGGQVWTGPHRRGGDATDRAAAAAC
ncbi:HNH nuclease [Anaeromyxobacter dehalogenans 2CP-1]|uniref:HNH nuclease n=1 Tax=Anaeromyxobacter dehalogenans (strain ATCC BAA-258 / DSM 21875 / 2CP-1) TaxID=455488 RepID=B8JCC9_ANAD2|nr:HNH endonuclease signature motif containing protein [Anaeromyxobacter dehalogenans]ACL65869.1 HNH nuclease [Anaeromyxobacter dehalogenans 2CP-1]